jgi:hypothetical protein
VPVLLGEGLASLTDGRHALRKYREVSNL